MIASLSAEAFRDVARVVECYQRGRITASKARELCEAIAFDGGVLDAMDPGDLGASLAERVSWAIAHGYGTTKLAADRLGADYHAVGVAIMRLARRGKIERVGHGAYVARRTDAE